MENKIKTELTNLIAIDEARKVRESKYKEYYVSIHDSYFSKNKRTGKVNRLTPVQVGGRYYKVGINGKMVSTHRLVAEAFDENFTDEYHINHISGDISDNRLSNIEVCTPQENILHRDVSKELNITISIADIKKIQEKHNVEHKNDVIQIINNININLLSEYEPTSFTIKFKE
ncbi:Uncharacterised protein [Macrococcoides caseolyticum]|uniref:HNH endonuclease n=1 Tax=Macrococcoides caseolyticum TaxID=69966 RepID=UPI000DFBE67F|nr:HNH endonuclease [Macrococcus caseolyticus]STY75771.1 Uncharacterised protein [Macrococcus caseolyticus]